MAIGARKNRVALDIDQIIEAAWRVVDRDGVDALSTRTLAAELNVQGPALYWHVRSKQQLLDLMIDRALYTSIAAPAAGLPWHEWLRVVMREQRRLLLQHRDSGRIASSAGASARVRSEVIPQIVEPLLRAGFHAAEANAAVGALASFVLGWVIYEQREETRDLVSALVDPDAGFEFGLDTLLDGLMAKTANQPPAQGRACTAS